MNYPLLIALFCSLFFLNAPSAQAERFTETMRSMSINLPEIRMRVLTESMDAARTTLIEGRNGARTVLNNRCQRIALDYTSERPSLNYISFIYTQPSDLGRYADCNTSRNTEGNNVIECVLRPDTYAGSMQNACKVVYEMRR